MASKVNPFMKNAKEHVSNASNDDSIQNTTLQQDYSLLDSNSKTEHIEMLIATNQQKNWKSNKQQVKISSKNYIPVWNFFATEQESKDSLKRVTVMGPKKQISSTQPMKVEPNQESDIILNSSRIFENYEPKEIEVFVESQIQFTIVIPNPNLTCGWLQSEVIRRYYEVLQQQAHDWE